MIELNLGNIQGENIGEARMIAAIKGIRLEVPILRSISETITDGPILLRFFPDSDRGRFCTVEFFKSLIKITKHCEVPLGKCDNFIDKAVSAKYSPSFASEVNLNIPYINRVLVDWQTNFTDVLKDTVADLKGVLKTNCDAKEFAGCGDIKGVDMNVFENLRDEYELRNAIWNSGLNEEEVNSLGSFWRNVSPEDRDAILYPRNHCPSELESSFALARFLGKPLSPKIEKLGKALASTLSELQY